MHACSHAAELSKSYQRAVEEDVVEVCEMKSNRSSNAQCFLYMVPSDWMMKVWPYLSYDERVKPALVAEYGISDSVGPVHCRPLLKKETFPDSNAVQSIQVKSVPMSDVRVDLNHIDDFFFMGQKAWKLVSNEFGFDVEVACPVTFNDASMYIQFTAWKKVDIPLSGRLDYKEDLSKPSSVSDDEMMDSTPIHQDSLELDSDANIAGVSDANHVFVGNRDDYWNENGKSPEPSLPRLKPHGTGLDNLGNTCFMNSTLQCLAHTDPLRRYFLSGEFEGELNRENPLGTGGELAIQFAKLLAEMWIERQPPVVSYTSCLDSVSPRDFKAVLGKHASQFVGYDQHDSQELATYLLDALHEDTNRVTKKPYIEKPEKKIDESDEDAARIAWRLHLTRENSRVLEQFMGQVKSRVECCRDQCHRVSTTFDPFMYLSVPIPGTSERSIEVTFVPLQPDKKPQRFTLMLPKSSRISELKQKALERLNMLGVDTGEVSAEDVIATDVFQNEVYAWHDESHEIDSIAANDQTFLYAVASTENVRQIAQKAIQARGNTCRTVEIPTRDPRHKLDSSTMLRLDQGDEWNRELTKYLVQELKFVNIFNPSKGSVSERVKFYHELVSFIDECSRADFDIPDEKDSANESKVDAIVEHCEVSASFKNVASFKDLAVLEYLARKIRTEIIDQQKAEREIDVGGILIEIRHNQEGKYSKKPDLPPLVLRVPGSMTVFDLRLELSERLSRSIKDGGTMGTREMLFRRTPLMYSRRRYGSIVGNQKHLGIIKDTYAAAAAKRSDVEEEVLIANCVGNCGSVWVEWTSETVNALDAREYIQVENPEQITSEDNCAPEKKTTTVLQCIEKYCQQEQLEESEMWYCNQCKDHVRAWKQFELFRCPPILIVHLKRFQFSARTHRRDKISMLIDFPLEGLDLTGITNHWSVDEKPVYDCYAVSNHFGGLGGGHYTAYCLNSDGTWCYYDDSRVTKEVDPKEVVSDAAYVLYYRRRDVPISDSFPLPLQTPEAVHFNPTHSRAIIVRQDSDDALSVSAEHDMETVTQSSEGGDEQFSHGYATQ